MFSKCTVSCASYQTVKLSTQNSVTVVKTQIELDSHADKCFVGDHCLIVHDHNRPMNIYGYDPKMELKHACTVDATIAYD